MIRKDFYNFVRKSSSGLFGGRLKQSQVDGMEAIMNAFVSFGDQREKTLAYAFATAYHETGRRMVPVREGFAKTDARARALVRRRRYGKAGNTGHVYYGRGHVQLTWQRNYRITGNKLGIDLEHNPDRMLEPELSARVLIEGLIDGRWNGSGKGIAFYLSDHRPDDLKNARRTVNVLDRWHQISGYYDVFLNAIQSAGGVPKTIVQPAKQNQIQDIPERGDTFMSTETKKSILLILLTLLEMLERKVDSRHQASSYETSEVDILKELLGKASMDSQLEKSVIGPVNGWLGQTIGGLLNGRKTALGLVGLLATVILPEIAPEITKPILESLGTAGGGINPDSDQAAKGQLILQWIFGALTTWGVAGKVEKAKPS
jgi:hypothetical protein